MGSARYTTYYPSHFYNWGICDVGNLWGPQFHTSNEMVISDTFFEVHVEIQIFLGSSFNPKAVDEWMCHHLSVRREMDISDWQTSLAGSKDFDRLMLHKPGSPVCITCGLENRDCPGHMGFGDSTFWVTRYGCCGLWLERELEESWISSG